MRSLTILTAATAIALSGCQTLSSKRIDPAFNANAHPGFHYTLPRATVKLRYSANTDGSSVAVSLVETALEPDPAHRYANRYLPSSTADDSIVIEVDAMGLLKSVDITTDDRTDEIAQKVIEIGKEVAKLQVAPAFAPRSIVRDMKPVLEWVIDPTSARELGWVNTTLSQVGLAVDVVDSAGTSMTVARTVPAKPLPNNASNTAEVTSDSAGSMLSLDCARSVCYRPFEPYRLLVTTTASPREVLGVHALQLPNRAPVVGIDVQRAAFVQKTTKIEFDKGRPTKLTLSKPSEALAFIEIPLNVVKAIAALPGEIVDANIAAIGKDKAQLEAMEGRLNVLERVQALEDRQADRAERAPTNPLGGPAPAARLNTSNTPACNPVTDSNCSESSPAPAATLAPAASTQTLTTEEASTADPSQFAAGYRLPGGRKAPPHLRP